MRVGTGRFGRGHLAHEWDKQGRHDEGQHDRTECVGKSQG